jgi:hypothetical protein
MIETGIIIHIINKREIMMTAIDFNMLIIKIASGMSIFQQALVGTIIESETMEDATTEKRGESHRISVRMGKCRK